jgi:hypothetical protein
MTDSVLALRELFHKNDPEVVLISYTRGHQAHFDLRDCDGYRAGGFYCDEVSALCLSTRWESYSDIEVHAKAALPSGLSHLEGAVIAGHVLVVLYSAGEDEDSALPRVNGRRCGYIICKSVDLEKTDARQLVP